MIETKQKFTDEKCQSAYYVPETLLVRWDQVINNIIPNNKELPPDGD